jgi:hypothetical protein
MQVQRKENELGQMKNVISSKEQEVARLKLQGAKYSNHIMPYVTLQIILVAELEKLQEKLTLNEHELQTARYWHYCKDALGTINRDTHNNYYAIVQFSILSR